MVENQNCSECGASDWKQVVSTDYPERRAERNRTVKTVHECKNCGAQGRHFEHKNSGTEKLTGAFR